MGEQLLVAGALIMANICEVLDVLSRLLYDTVFSEERRSG